MSGAEIVGSPAAILQIVDQAVELSRLLRRCCKKVKYAKKDVEILRYEMLTFNSQLSILHESVQLMEERKLSLEQHPTLKELVVQIQWSGEGRLNDIESIMKQLEPMRKDRESSWISRVQAHVTWLILDRFDLRDTVDGMRGICTWIGSFHSITMFHVLIAEIGRLQEENKEIPKELEFRIKVLQKQVKLQAQQCKEAERKYENLKRSTDGSGESVQTFRLVTNLVKELVKEEIEKAQATVDEISFGSSSRSEGPSITGDIPGVAQTRASPQPPMIVELSNKLRTARRGARISRESGVGESGRDRWIGQSKEAVVHSNHTSTTEYPSGTTTSGDESAPEFDIVIDDDGNVHSEEGPAPRPHINNSNTNYERPKVNDDDGSVESEEQPESRPGINAKSGGEDDHASKGRYFITAARLVGAILKLSPSQDNITNR